MTRRRRKGPLVNRLLTWDVAQFVVSVLWLSQLAVAHKETTSSPVEQHQHHLRANRNEQQQQQQRAQMPKNAPPGYNSEDHKKKYRERAAVDDCHPVGYIGITQPCRTHARDDIGQGGGFDPGQYPGFYNQFDAVFYVGIPADQPSIGLVLTFILMRLWDTTFMAAEFRVRPGYGMNLDPVMRERLSGEVDQIRQATNISDTLFPPLDASADDGGGFTVGGSGGAPPPSSDKTAPPSRAPRGDDDPIFGPPHVTEPPFVPEPPVITEAPPPPPGETPPPPPIETPPPEPPMFVTPPNAPPNNNATNATLPPLPPSGEDTVWSEPPVPEPPNGADRPPNGVEPPPVSGADPPLEEEPPASGQDPPILAPPDWFEPPPNGGEPPEPPPVEEPPPPVEEPPASGEGPPIMVPPDWFEPPDPPPNSGDVPEPPKPPGSGVPPPAGEYPPPFTTLPNNPAATTTTTTATQQPQQHPAGVYGDPKKKKKKKKIPPNPTPPKSFHTQGGNRERRRAGRVIGPQPGIGPRPAGATGGGPIVVDDSSSVMSMGPKAPFQLFHFNTEADLSDVVNNVAIWRYTLSFAAYHWNYNQAYGELTPTNGETMDRISTVMGLVANATHGEILTLLDELYGARFFAVNIDGFVYPSIDNASFEAAAATEAPTQAPGGTGTGDAVSNNDTTSMPQTGVRDDNWSSSQDGPDWQGFAGLGLFVAVATTCSILTLLGWQRRQQRNQRFAWADLSTEEGLSELLSTGWVIKQQPQDPTANSSSNGKSNNSAQIMMELYDKSGLGYEDDSSIFLGGFEQRETVIGTEVLCQAH